MIDKLWDEYHQERDKLGVQVSQALGNGEEKITIKTEDYQLMLQEIDFIKHQCNEF
jgi:hypothetical protein